MGNSCTGKSNTVGTASEPEACLPFIKRAEVAKHNTPEDCWIIIDNIVYNVSQYWSVHPGGGDYIKRWAGKDATLAYREFNHSRFADVQLKTLGAEVGQIDDKLEQFDEKFFAETPLPQKTADIEAFSEKGDMMCYQCQQTVNGVGCTDVGVCGKSPTIAALQDLIVHYLKGLSQYLIKVDDKHWDNHVYNLFLHCFFMTLTNVNFNLEKHFKYLKDLAESRDKYRKIYEEETPEDKREAFLTDPNSPSNFVYKSEDNYLFQEARKVGIVSRKKVLNPDLFGLIEMCAYGLKGAAAYLYHAEGIRNETEGVYDETVRKEAFKQLFVITAGLTSQEPDLQYLLGLNMDLGKANFQVMDMLDKGHNVAFGKPTPSEVNRAPVEGKCILISGHDMMVLKKLLKQTEGKGVNIFTHGEMLPALGYPELKKYPHLVGNFGTAWFNQTNEFPDFPGAILLNSNCLIQPQPSYAKRIFTTHIVGWDNIKHIEGDDFSEVIDCALKQPGFKKSTRQFKKYQNVESEMTGFGHAAMVELLVPEIQAGNLKEIYLIGGCDNLDPSRQKYLQTMLELPETAIILTLGCAKFRLFGYKEKLGYLPGGNKVPRLIDVGQCNDAYSAVKVALALTELLGVGVNELPLHLVLSWVEQKAVIILLTLLHLGIQNINIGPNLPGFLTPTLVNYLVENFKLAPMDLPKQFINLQKFDAKSVDMPRQAEMFGKLANFELCQMKKKEQVAVNIYKFTYGFLNGESTCNLRPGQHVVFRVKNDKGEYISRAYTPITAPGTKGQFEIIVKIYPEGIMSNFMKDMAEGDYLEVQGPCGSTLYSEDANKKVSLVSDQKNFNIIENINMVAGGTSVVSMYQIVQEIVAKKQNVKANLIVANSKVPMKVMEKEFEELRSRYADNIQVKYITSDVEGRISKEIFEGNLIQDKKSLNLVAGPLNFRNTAEQIFEGMGYDMNNIVHFF